MGLVPIFYFSIMDLQTLIEPTLAGMGYEMVALERVGRGLLRLYIDKAEGITLDDCVKVSNQLTRLFLVENVDYDRLEVSSPGLDRPLVKEADFVRFAGERANIRLHAPLDGRKRFTGVLRGLADGVLQLEMDGAMVAIPLAEVDSARLAPELEGHTRRMR
ncbi:MAG TPA: ribosome maturation factor RimP [Thiobacillaceae bacterium]|nr:ribosome maturation factor RimP [Thiobacillaceae bacterium]HNH89894.1 ribosome maturation factor RimP [Thiobacillaceae bacterium]HNI08437.1 ribosome maturation factor RimP [Thiobacillaceae bacterium]